MNDLTFKYIYTYPFQRGIIYLYIMYNHKFFLPEIIEGVGVGVGVGVMVGVMVGVKVEVMVEVMIEVMVEVIVGLVVEVVILVVEVGAY